mgnify:CR=1 FL=1
MYVRSSYAFNEASKIAVDQYVKYNQNLNSDIQLLRIADFDSIDQLASLASSTYAAMK